MKRELVLSLSMVERISDGLPVVPHNNLAPQQKELDNHVSFHATSKMKVLTVAFMTTTLVSMLLIRGTNAFSTTTPIYVRESTRTGLGVLPIQASSTIPKLGRTLRMGSSTDFDATTSNDPFQILGLTEPTADKKVIKRAYKRMAMKYHPDIVTNKDSTAEEKKQASDTFAKINWAYEVLSGKRQDSTTYKSSTSTAGTSSSSSSGWTPPHRRTKSSYSSSSSSWGGSTGSTGGSTDWRDYMPKYKDEEDYDTGGDSFEAIFSDLVQGVAMGAATGGNSIFKDFIDFLEGNVDGFSQGGSSANEDSELRSLLQTGSLQEIAEEMDDTELLVQQLTTKLESVNDDILTTTAELKVSARYVEKIPLEEKLAELQARRKVVKGYVSQAQRRLVKLQTRYKGLITYGGENDTYAGGRSTTTRPYTSTSSSSYRSGDDGRRGSSFSSSSSNPQAEQVNTSSADDDKEDDKEDAWKRQGFGSSSYGRGGSRSRSRRRTQPSREQQSTVGANDSSYSRRQTDSGNSATSSSSAYSSSPSRPPFSGVKDENIFIPPHRRQPSFDTSMKDDKKRLRQLKVDEEFDKLKKELGL